MKTYPLPRGNEQTAPIAPQLFSSSSTFWHFWATELKA